MPFTAFEAFVRCQGIHYRCFMFSVFVQEAGRNKEVLDVFRFGFLCVNETAYVEWSAASVENL